MFSLDITAQLNGAAKMGNTLIYRVLKSNEGAPNSTMEAHLHFMKTDDVPVDTSQLYEHVKLAMGVGCEVFQTHKGTAPERELALKTKVGELLQTMPGLQFEGFVHVIR